MKKGNLDKELVFINLYKKFVYLDFRVENIELVMLIDIGVINLFMSFRCVERLVLI